MCCIQTSVVVTIFELIWVEKTINIFKTKLGQKYELYVRR